VTYQEYINFPQITTRAVDFVSFLWENQGKLQLPLNMKNTTIESSSIKQAAKKIEKLLITEAVLRCNFNAQNFLHEIINGYFNDFHASTDFPYKYTIADWDDERCFLELAKDFLTILKKSSIINHFNLDMKKDDSKNIHVLKILISFTSIDDICKIFDYLITENKLELYGDKLQASKIANYLNQKMITFINKKLTLNLDWESKESDLNFISKKDATHIRIMRTLRDIENLGFIKINYANYKKKEQSYEPTTADIFILNQAGLKSIILKDDTTKVNTKNDDSELLSKIINTLNKTEGYEHKFPYKLPAGTEWKNIIIKFEDDENILIKVKHHDYHSDFKEMGFHGKGKRPKPSEAWIFLKILSRLNGEISIKDAEAKDKYKKQKEILSKRLKAYFSIDEDPFFPYHYAKSYRIKMTLIPPQAIQQPTNVSNDIDEDTSEFMDFYNDSTPSIFES
jgi:hypothetical protein